VLVKSNLGEKLKTLVAKYASDKLKMEIAGNFSKVASPMLKRSTAPKVERNFPLVGSVCKDKITA
jgi:hypothetical protein